MNSKLYTTNLLKTAIITLLTTTTLYAQNKPSRTHIGLIYPLSSNGRHAPLDSNTFSFNLLAGVSAAEDGFTLAGLTNIIHHTSKGVQIAGLSNHISQNAEGLRIAGLMNLTGESRGLSVAGLLNKSNDMKGAQAAGFMNLAQNSTGFQVAGFLNKSKNISSQIAGFANIADSVKNVQVAGFFNKSRNTTSQIAGFMNIAKKVKGVQIAAFMNIADSSDYPIGLINLIKNGEKSIAITVDDNLTTMLTFRSGGRILYGIIGAGYNFKNDKEVYAFEAGFGAHVYTSQAFRLNLELTAASLSKNFKNGEYFKSSFKILPAFRVNQHLEVFGGPTFNYVNTNTAEGRKLTEKFISKWDNKDNNRLQGIYAGYTAGVQYIF
ncbi:hypothetical protein HDE68_000769 [Pedobacter cryoconitis]|uniref:Uncharacterized protein n=1 Tax=Pedobacter cryoconitis TaxID=188932 RepID=A0A7W9DY57_9SPHI|nr:hypothetical protein [Pedobacter cryoconitis]MBB5634884.1 hypothetical protein [Pedobacter cryoconitis]